MLLKEVKLLLLHQIKRESRQRYVLGSVLLYVIATTFICYLSFSKITSIPLWNALFWIIIVFTCTQAVSKDFFQETEGKQIYLFTVCSPQAFILARIAYNAVFMAFLSLVSLLCYTLFMGNEVLLEANMSLLITTIIIGSAGFSTTLTMIGAIANKTSNNSGLMAILGFPIILPFLLNLIKLSKSALDGFSWEMNLKYIIVLLLIKGLVIALSYVLFPYLWRD